MRLPRVAVLLLLSSPSLGLCLFHAGCGGETRTANDTGGPDDSRLRADATPDAVSGYAEASDGGVDCKALSVQLDQFQMAADPCCMACQSAQCLEAVEGACCPVFVNSADAAAARAFEAAAANYRALCRPICTLTCPLHGACRASGHCN